MEQHGPASLLPPALKGATWQPLAPNSLPFSLQQFQLYHSGFPVQGSFLSAGCQGQRCLISACLPLGNIFASREWTSPPQKGCWVFNPADQQYHLAAVQQPNAYSLQYRFANDSTLVQDQRRFLYGDTSTKALVFLPDPLSPSNWLYGSPLADHNDSTYPAIEATQKEVMLHCLWQNDSFRLQNTWLQFGNVSDPVMPHAVSRGDFRYRRNQPQFEEVTVFYHLQQLQLWWDSLGCAAWKDTVLVDVHAYSGADESAYNPLPVPPTIEFGDGGVDDAEDGDSPAHEYTHAAFQSVVPGGYQGTQRQAVEEGCCDFMAVCYSRRYTKNQAGLVYNWDGHNNFWPGRNLLNSRVFPGSLTNQPHIDGQLFGGALFDLAQEIGDDSAVRLLMHTMPFLSPGIGMKQAAQLLLHTDSLLFNGRNQWPLVKALHPRGLLPQASVTSVSAPNLLLRNTAAFANGGTLFLTVPADSRIQLLDLQGRLLQSTNLRAGDTYSLSGATLGPGVYLLQCGTATFRVVRY